MISGGSLNENLRASACGKKGYMFLLNFNLLKGFLRTTAIPACLFEVEWVVCRDNESN